ncbi:MAG: chemotaxis-specific protein-glutamate methyltransferase CheB [Alphaproteobacteria bacterium]|nr:chemotaxis-specific protein-glutamate methyltransferase CheB [Alphaproteobacteria bacterium]
MLVDDSAIIRGAIARILKEDPVIHIIDSVSNGQLGVDAAKKHQPHVVILDVEMPIMDGITALPKILEVSPQSKVIMFSTLTEKGAAISIKALSLGAVECMPKPSSTQVEGGTANFQDRILNLVKSLVPESKRVATGTAAGAPAPSPAPKAPASFSLRKDPMAYTGKPALVAIGSSTGGPQALFNVLKHFSGFDVPIILTQHMPATFTKILAEHIHQQTGLTSTEGGEGMRLEKGKVHVAPGGYHMLLKRDGVDTVITLNDGPAENFCKPAVDPMFRSAIDIYGKRVLGLILTGMGHDGLGGGKALVEASGRLIAQDEKTSVVWGMPGAVAMAGICSEVLPLDDIGPWVRKAVLG